jgi:hypothetical protein
MGKRRNENGLKSLILRKTATWLIRRRQRFQGVKGPHAKRFVSHGEMELRRAQGAPEQVGAKPDARR